MEPKLVELINQRDFFDYFNIFINPIVAIITFLLGFLVSNWSHNRKYNRQLKSLQEYFILYLKKQKKAFNSQITKFKRMKSFAKELKNFDGFTYEYVHQPVRTLESINKELLFQAWKKDNKNEDELFDALRFIELFNNNIENFNSYHKVFAKQLDEIRIRWNQGISEIHKFKNRALNLPAEVIVKTSHLNFLNEQYNHWIKEDNKELEYTIVNLIDPLDKYFGDVYGKDPSNEIAIILLQLVQHVGIIKLEFDALLETYVKNVDKLLEIYESNNKDLNI